MAEEKYAVPANPTYSENIRKLQDTDPASASQIFNPLFSRLIENIASVKREADEVSVTASSIVKRDITVPADGWRDSPVEEGEPEGLCVDVSHEIIREDMVPFLTVLPACLNIAGGCGLSSTVRTLNGGLRVYAKRAPAAAMEASLTLVRLSGCLGDSRIAEDSEIGSMLDEVLRGIIPDTAGGWRIAGDSEVAQALDRVFRREE